MPTLVIVVRVSISLTFPGLFIIYLYLQLIMERDLKIEIVLENKRFLLPCRASYVTDLKTLPQPELLQYINLGKKVRKAYGTFTMIFTENFP